MTLQGKTALVTGGAMGLGLGVAEALVERGAKVVILDVSEAKGRKEVADLNDKYGVGAATFIPCDVSKVSQLESSFQQTVSMLGHIDIVFNNAGLITESNWEYAIDVNFKGVVAGTNLAVAHMRRDKGGKGGVIINTASIAGFYPRYVSPVYAATKSAVIGFTANWASNPYLKEMGLRFGTLCPRPMDTAFLEDSKRALYPEAFRDYFKINQPQPVSQAVEAFLHLLQDDESNGSNLVVTTDGFVYQHQVVRDGKGLPPI